MQFGQVNRRNFIALLGGAATAWPLAARAQQPNMPVIGFLGATSPDVNANRLRVFRQGLKDTGYVEGDNVTIEYRWAENQMDRLPELAAELVHRPVAVIATIGNTPLALAAKAATTTIPIVFAVGEDPVRLGLVASLARPGGNATGINFFTNEVVAKRLRLLHDLTPKAVRIAVLVNPVNASSAEAAVRDVRKAAPTLGLQIQVLNASTIGEIDAAFATLESDRPDALFVAPDAFFASRTVQFVTLTARDKIPAAYSLRAFVAAGGLMSYGADTIDPVRRAGGYVARILKGEKPGDLPVQAATKFDLVVNLKAAKALGLIVPPSLLVAADEVIE